MISRLQNSNSWRKFFRRMKGLWGPRKSRFAKVSRLVSNIKNLGMGGNSESKIELMKTVRESEFGSAFRGKPRKAEVEVWEKKNQDVGCFGGGSPWWIRRVVAATPLR